MAAKKKIIKLIDEVANLPDRKTKMESCCAHLQKSDPEMYSQLLEVARDFVAGGVVAERLQSISAFHRWVVDRGIFKVPIGRHTFAKWLTMLNENG